jgi:hypothetical protein
VVVPKEHGYRNALPPRRGEREGESERGLRVAEYNPRGLGVLNTQVIAVS